MQITTEDTRLVRGEMDDGSGKGGDTGGTGNVPWTCSQQTGLVTATAGGCRPLIGQKLSMAASDWLAGHEAGAS